MNIFAMACCPLKRSSCFMRLLLQGSIVAGGIDCCL
jgi:hypothetical protein